MSALSPPAPLSEPVDDPELVVDPGLLSVVVVTCDAPPKLVWATDEGWQDTSKSASVCRVCTCWTVAHFRPTIQPPRTIIDGEPDGDVASDHDVSIDPGTWLRCVAFDAHGLTLHLAVPDKASDDALPDPKHLPPRLAKIARLVVAGCTDKQIAGQTGLSFSTVRTYVRQIYRRLGVHTRVELVHASLAEK